MYKRKQIIFEILTGKKKLSELGKLDIEFELNNKGYYEIHTSNVEIELNERDVVSGYMKYKDEQDNLRLWASLILAISTFKFTEPFFEEHTLDSLWNISFGQKPNTNFIKLVHKYGGR